MLYINLNDLLDVEEDEIAEKLREAGPEFRLTMSVSDQYRASSKTDLAENWLKSWYIAETLASHASEWRCEFEEGDEGAGEFDFRFVVSDAKGMAAVITAFAPVFDPDDLEARTFIYDEAHDWLEKRGEEAARFPNIEESYRGDAEVAREFEGYMEARDDNEDE